MAKHRRFSPGHAATILIAVCVLVLGGGDVLAIHFDLLSDSACSDDDNLVSGGATLMLREDCTGDARFDIDLGQGTITAATLFAGPYVPGSCSTSGFIGPLTGNCNTAGGCEINLTQVQWLAMYNDQFALQVSWNDGSSGTSWARVDGPKNPPDCPPAVPALSTWSVMLTVVLLAAAGAFVLRRMF